MAHIHQRRPENTSGDFYVDSTCIDCDTCRWMAPQVFHQDGEQSAVYHQPTSETERLKAMQALLSCPTSSIGTVEKPQDIKYAQETIPILVENNVYHCGYHSQKSYAAASYLIVRAEGNILVDSPRFAPPLVKRIEELGGIEYIYLTHQDDVADHQKFRDHFQSVSEGARDRALRIIHEKELGQNIRDVEIKLTGTQPYQLAEDLLIITVPGHSKGHTVLLYKNKFLFTGDHLAWSEELDRLYAFADYCWYSWPEQIQSMRNLANYSFEWVLPGHGRRYHADRETMRQQMHQCISWMEAYKK